MLKEWMNTFENQNAKRKQIRKKNKFSKEKTNFRKKKQIFEKKQNNAMKSLEATNSKGHKSCVA